MAHPPGALANRERAALIDTTRVPSSLERVATAIAIYTEHAGSVYVERFGDRWRWSPAHRGGAYPLLRVVSRFLRVDHHRIIVPFRTVEDGRAALNREDGNGPEPDAAAIVSFTETRPSATRTRTGAGAGWMCGPGGRRTPAPRRARRACGWWGRAVTAPRGRAFVGSDERTPPNSSVGA